MLVDMSLVHMSAVQSFPQPFAVRQLVLELHHPAPEKLALLIVVNTQ